MRSVVYASQWPNTLVHPASAKVRLLLPEGANSQRPCVWEENSSQELCWWRFYATKANSLFCFLLSKHYNAKKGVGVEEENSWILKETGDDELLPQARILLEDKIVELLSQSQEPLAIKELAEKLQTQYEYARRCCTELFGQGRIKRKKVTTKKQGHPSYRYGLEID